MLTNDLHVRRGTASDAAEVARLMNQLGYPLDERTASERLGRLSSDDSRAIFLACAGTDVLGCLESRIAETIESGSLAEIVGLIVDRNARRRGVGTALINEVSDWAAKQGQARVRVRTNVVRADATAFYAGRRFRPVKQQQVLDLSLTR